MIWATVSSRSCFCWLYTDFGIDYLVTCLCRVMSCVVGKGCFLWPVLSLREKSLSRVRLFATPWTVAYQAPLSMRFSRQEYWSGLPFPSPGDLPDPGIEPRSPALESDALTSEPPGKPHIRGWILVSREKSRTLPVRKRRVVGGTWWGNTIYWEMAG